MYSEQQQKRERQEVAIKESNLQTLIPICQLASFILSYKEVWFIAALLFFFPFLLLLFYYSTTSLRFIMAATLIQPISNNNNVMNENQVLTLLEGGSSSSIKNDDASSDGKFLMQTPSSDNLQEQQEILAYLKPSPVSSYNARKVPRLGPFLLLKTLGVGEFGKVKLGRHIETGQIVSNRIQFLDRIHV